MRLVVLIAVLLALCFDSAKCCAQVPARRNAMVVQPRSDADLERLINWLAATKPFSSKLGNGPFGEPQILRAADTLHEQGLHAFPALIKHFDDKRYCCWEESPSTDVTHQRTVGYVCHRIVEQQIRKYVGWKVPDPRGTPGYGVSVVPNSEKEATEWLKANAGKQLWELQADFARRVIKENEARLEAARDDKTRQLCRECITANQALAETLATTRVPLPTAHFRPFIER